MSAEWQNKLYFGDNLGIVREYVADESVDLIYLDPPFNSQATYNVLFQEKNGSDSPAQITAFEDFWHWDMQAERTFHEVVTAGPKQVADLLQALRGFLGSNDMMAYLTMMAIRLVELHRVLKPTGSIYLHCDPVASHYLKLVMDAVFAPEQFQREIIWRIGWVSGYKTQAKNWIRNHDTLLFYTKSQHFTFNKEYISYRPGYRRRDGSKPTGKGIPIEDTWNCHPEDDLNSIMIMSFSGEKLGYPTQKPEALLERIIKASSNEGDLVLDPFCGCGTTLVAAERLHRRWIGIDITHLAITLMKRRLTDTFGPDLSPYQVIGEPQDLPSARALAAENRYQFEWWALGLVEARPAQDKKKGADKGVDGEIVFFDDDSGKAKKIIVQVKSGKPSVSHIRDLKGVMEREQAEIAAYLTLEEPTGPMKKEAAEAGFYDPPGLLPPVPRVQIRTIQELLSGRQLDYPKHQVETFQKAPRQFKGKREKG